MNKKRNAIKYLLISFFLIALDQATKLLVHFNMEPGFPGQIVLLGDWLKLHYVLNPGMAFGMQLGHEYGKLFLTLFRLAAMVMIGWYLIRLASQNVSSTLLLALSLILAGAVGNVIDSTFYGVFLGNAPVGSPTPWFHGQVVDMIFVDFWEGFLPDWIPLFGGQYYSTPIFNVADSCIFIGVCIILIFQGHFYVPQEEKSETSNSATDSDASFSNEEKQELTDEGTIANDTHLKGTDDPAEEPQAPTQEHPNEVPLENPSPAINTRDNSLPNEHDTPSSSQNADEEGKTR